MQSITINRVEKEGKRKKLNQGTIRRTIYQPSKLFMDPFRRSINPVDLSRRPQYIYTHTHTSWRKTKSNQPPSTQPCLYKQGYCFAAIAATVERYTPLSARVSIAEALFPSGQVTSHALVIGHQPIRISSTVSVPPSPENHPCMDDPFMGTGWQRPVFSARA